MSVDVSFFTFLLGTLVLWQSLTSRAVPGEDVCYDLQREVEAVYARALQFISMSLFCFWSGGIDHGVTGQSNQIGKAVIIRSQR